MKKLFLYTFLLTSITVFGNNFNYEASIYNAVDDGFHKVLLQPEVTSKMKADFSDIRIYDSAMIEIPYLFEQENRVNEKELFTEYKIIKKKHFRSRGYTRIVIHNHKKTKIDNIVLEIKNADVRKRLKLNASYDNKEWYVLNDNYYYNSIEGNNSTSELRVMNFPLSDYEYYELLIDDYFDKPINVVKAGYYDMQRESGKYTKIEGGKLAKTDTLKQTILSIPVNNNYVDKLAFEISAPRYYNRKAEVFVRESIVTQNKTSIHDRTIGSFNLISNSSNAIALYNLKVDTIYVRVFNNDNQPLNIDAVKPYQLNKYLIAELSANQSYTIAYANKDIHKPVYDLKYFTDIIPDDIETLEVNNIECLLLEPKSTSGGNFNLNDHWLWISIVAIALLLGYMSYTMLREKKKE